MVNGTQPTSARSTAGRFPKPISGASALRARISQLQAQEPDWPETAAVSFEKYFGFLKKWKKQIDPSGCSTRMLRACLVHDQDSTTFPFCLKWKDWGMMSNGRFLTAKIGQFRKTGRGSILSDILEAAVDQQFFLSRQQMEKIVLS